VEIGKLRAEGAPLGGCVSKFLQIANFRPPWGGNRKGGRGPGSCPPIAASESEAVELRGIEGEADG